MTKPTIIFMTDGSQAAIWPTTGRATVARHQGSHFDQDRESCAAGDFVADHAKRRKVKAVLALARAAADGAWKLRGGHD